MTLKLNIINYFSLQYLVYISMYLDSKSDVKFFLLQILEMRLSQRQQAIRFVQPCQAASNLVWKY